MNKWTLLFWVAATVCAEARHLTTEETNARVGGASACVYLRVVDDRGAIVTNAIVLGNFHMNDDKGHPFKGTTDTGGIYVASGKCVGDWHYVISKDGYYETSGGGSYRKTGVADGRWQPYGMTNTVVLKRKVNPVAMAVHRDTNRLALPKQDEWTGFDLEYADWTAPHGKGKREDFQVFFRLEATNKLGGFGKYALTLRFTKPFDGGCLMKKASGGSAFQTLYEADPNRIYDSEITFTHERKTDSDRNKVIVHDRLLNADEYLVLRVRSETDKDGRLVKANYAKLYAPLFAAKYGFLISSYFNPEINNPSLEADTTKNLLNPRDLGFPP